MKLYTITRPGKEINPALLTQAKQEIIQFLDTHPTRHEHYGVGFACVHEGKGENQVIIDRWINENELMHQILVSPESDPLTFSLPPKDHNSVCVWELALQGFEREAWLRHVLNSDQPNFEEYQAERLNTEA